MIKNVLSANYILYILIAILPAVILSPSAIINSSIILCNLLYLYIIFIEKKIILKKSFSFYVLVFFFCSLLINLIFSLFPENSLSRIFGFLRFILLVFAIQLVLENFSNVLKKKIFLSWTLIFVVISFDLLIEFSTGTNLLGNISYMPGRLSSVLGNELKIGNYYYAFGLLIASFLYYNFKNNNLVYITLALTLFISFIIGERSNFIKYIFMTILYLFLFDRKKIFFKILAILISLLILFTFLFSSNTYKVRFWDMFIGEFSGNLNIIQIINKSPYGGHWNAAYEIFQDNKIFGVGIKNYRIVSGDEKYFNKDVTFSITRQNTHPHQLHLEFLSETGLFGFVCFLIFVVTSAFIGFKNYILNNNLFALSALLFFLASTLLPLPSGSFFTTYGAIIFWINYAIMISRQDKIFH